MQALVLQELKLLGKGGVGYRVLAALMQRVDRYIDPASIYEPLRELEKKKFIECIAARIEGRGPPQRYFRVTDAGTKALKTSIAHYLDLAEHFKNKTRAD